MCWATPTCATTTVPGSSGATTGTVVEWSYHRDRPVTAYFLYIVSIILIVAMLIVAALYFKALKSGKKSKLLVAVDLPILAVYAVFLLWYFNVIAF